MKHFSRKVKSIVEVLRRGEEMDQRLRAIARRDEIREVLKSKGKTPDDLEESFHKLMAAGMGDASWNIVSAPDDLALLFELKEQGLSDLAIAGKFWERSDVKKGKSGYYKAKELASLPGKAVRRNLPENPMSSFVDRAGDAPYRDLIKHHIRRQSASRLQAAVRGEVSLLPEHLHEPVIQYIDEVGLHFTCDKEFWNLATCREAFASIIEVAIGVLPIKEAIPSAENALRPENQLLAFQLFQIATLSFAYSASLQRKQRKFMGIRKGFFR